ncbi:hypothetical protein PENTCL1PPCAC_20745, partial [Pristionchus entomophagus]
TAEEYQCKCSYGWFGPNCDQYLYGKNGGVITRNNKCRCRCGFGGVMCEDVIDEEPDPNPNCMPVEQWNVTLYRSPRPSHIDDEFNWAG